MSNADKKGHGEVRGAWITSSEERWSVSALKNKQHIHTSSSVLIYFFYLNQMFSKRIHYLIVFHPHTSNSNCECSKDLDQNYTVTP